MCWKTMEISPDTLIEKTAVNDIVAYKVLLLKDGKFISYFEGFEYTPQKKYSIGEGLRLSKELYAITKGFHSYNRKCRVKTWGSPNGTFGIDGPSQNWNLQIYCPLKKDNYGRGVLARCIIPAGSKYYENEFGEIVSDGICLTGDYIQSDDLDVETRGCINPGRYMTFDQIFEHLNVNK